MDKQTRKEKVFTLLADGLWHSTMDINAVDVGGSEGCKRLRELRADGYVIEKRRKEGSQQWEYRLIQKKTLGISSKSGAETAQPAPSTHPSKSPTGTTDRTIPHGGQREPGFTTTSGKSTGAEIAGMNQLPLLRTTTECLSPRSEN